MVKREPPTKEMAGRAETVSDAAFLTLEAVPDVVDPSSELALAPPLGGRRQLVRSREFAFPHEAIDHRFTEACPVLHLIQLEESIRLRGVVHFAPLRARQTPCRLP